MDRVIKVGVKLLVLYRIEHALNIVDQTRLFFFLIHVGCPGQLTRTTTIPHGPLDILQAQEQVRYRGGDRRAHRGSNPGGGRNKSTMVHNS
jgi:hypothetical protein